MKEKKSSDEENQYEVEVLHTENDYLLRGEKPNYLKKLNYEILQSAGTGGLNLRTLGTVIVICLPLSVTSSIIYYDPNLKAGELVAKKLRIPKPAAQVPLVGGAVSSNFILNAYFSYDVPKNIIDEVKSIPWPLLPKSTAAMINYEPNPWYQTLGNGVKGLVFLSLKSIPVILSTAQYVALGADSKLSSGILIAQVGAYGLMHWFAVTHFIDNWMSKIFEVAKKPYLKLSKKADILNEMNLERKNLIGVYKHTINNALSTVRNKLQTNQRETLSDIFEKLSEIKEMTRRLSKEKYKPEKDLINLYNLSFRLQLQLLEQAEEQKTSETNWLKLVPIHILNAVLIKLCYIGFDLSVWSRAPDFCTQLIKDQVLCHTRAFIIPATIVTLFPLSYLAAFIAAPENTKKLWHLAKQLRAGNYIKPLALQYYPKLSYVFIGSLITLALFSWGTTVTLNQSYIHNPNSTYSNTTLDALLIAANTNSIVYNTYFNSFPIPYVALSFAVLGNMLWNKIKSSCTSQDQKSDKKLEAFEIENYLAELPRHVDLLGTINILRQIKDIGGNEEIKILFGGKQPNEILGDWAQEKSWKEAIDFLVTPFDSLKNKIDINECQKENNKILEKGKQEKNLQSKIYSYFFPPNNVKANMSKTDVVVDKKEKNKSSFFYYNSPTNQNKKSGSCLCTIL